jgi:hypothetical protein
MAADAPVCDVLRRILHRARASLSPDGMHLYTEVLDINNTKDVDAVIQIQHERFPPSAYMFAEDLRCCMDSYERNWGVRPKALLAKVNGEVVGFSLYSETARSMVAGYLAVSERSPKNVITQSIISQLGRRSRELGDLPIIFEVRDPEGKYSEPAKDTARIKLFQRYGARIIDSVYLLVPDMEHFPNPGAEEPYLIMYGRPGSMPAELTREEIRIIVSDLYNIFYRYWFSNHVRSEQLDSYLADLIERVMISVPPKVSLREI